jgi:type IV secretory pathway VirB10-like protein
MGISLLMAVESIAVDRLSPQQTTTAQNGQTTTGRANSTAGQILLNTANQELQRRYAVPPKVTMEPGRLVSIITTGSIEIPPVANTR